MAKEGYDNSSGTASVILGILSIVSILFTFFAIFAPVAGIILAIIAFVFALSQRKHTRNSWSTAGLTLAIIGFILNLLVIIGLISMVVSWMNAYQELCDAAGGCDNVLQYLQQQQINSVYGGDISNAYAFQ